MPSPYKQYTKEIYVNVGYMATWLPGIPLRLGDIGTITKGEYEYVANITDAFGISFDIREDDTPCPINYSTEKAVYTHFKAAGKTPIQISQLALTQAGVTIEMKRENAILFQAPQTYSHMIVDQISLGKKIIQLYREKKWRPEYFIITEILNAETATILISSAAKSLVEVSATSSITPGIFSLADINAGLKLERVQNMHTSIIAEAELTPLFRAHKVKRRKFGLGEPVFRGGGPDFLEMSPEDLDYEE